MKRSGPAAIVNTWLMMIIPRRESEPPSTFPGIRLTYLPIYRISGADSREKVAERAGWVYDRIGGCRITVGQVVVPRQPHVAGKGYGPDMKKLKYL